MKMTLFQLATTRHETTVGAVDNVVNLIEHLDQAWVQTVVARADLVRQVEGFDPKLHYHEDQDFLFRMTLVTRFCYVNLPMVLIDRSPADQRHVGRALEWHKEDFRLRMLQYRFEKDLGLSEGLDPTIQKSFRRSLRQIHSAWANWSLQRGDYEKARESVSQAAKYDLTPNIALKWVLIHMAPRLARRAVLTRAQIKARRTVLDPHCRLAGLKRYANPDADQSG